MSYLLAAYLIALAVSLFFASWRAAIWAVAAESLVSGLIAARGEGFATWPARIQLADLLLVRAVILPLAFTNLLKRLGSRREFDTIPANFVVWAVAVTLVIASFWFSRAIFPASFQDSLHLGTGVAGILLGFFVLANQTSPIGQLIGLLTFESGTLLTETLGPPQEEWFLQLGLSLVFVWALAVFWGFLVRFSRLEPAGAQGAPLEEEREVL